MQSADMKINGELITFWWLGFTSNERIAYVTFFAGTNRDVIVYAAPSI